MSRYIDTLPTPTYVKPKKLVVLSASRSGTLGIYQALKQLGYKPYHMAEVLITGVPAIKILMDGMVAEMFHEGKPYGRAEFDKWFADYDVITEIPFYMLRSVLKAYPDAKFLLTERNPEKWAKSFENTVGITEQRMNTLPMSMLNYFDGRASHLGFFNRRMVDYNTNGFGVSDKGREALIENYKAYIADVKRLVPPEQLTVCKLEDGFGWKELCPCLGVPIPDTPWPSLNTTEEFHSVSAPMHQRVVKKGIIRVTTIIAIAAVGLWTHWEEG
ncbi:hypothetical protein F5Y19DRAFT_476646 [Xylariaceae sp. FL1651]|nr:hypothetical protein F5Y19DRAFT_476646 [Xylariaceae sp. FL1651]